MRIALHLFISFKLISTISTYEQPCEKRLAILIREPVINDTKLIYKNFTFNEDQYFEDIYNNETVTYACLCNIKTCYRKCCRKGYVMKDNCTESDNAEDYYKQIQIYDKTTRLNLSIGDVFKEIYEISCASGQVMVLNPQKGQEFYLQANGSLLYTSLGYEYWAIPGDFCIELYERDGIQQLIPQICQEVAITDITSTSVLYASLMIICLPFWLITFLVYTLIPELRNLHGKCLANYAICVFMAFFFLCVVDISGRYINLYVCLFSAFVIYSIYMASFLWLNVMCIDIWLTFSGRRGLTVYKHEEKKKYLVYNIYVWGVTAIFLFNVLFLQFYGPKHFPHLVLPQIGVHKCWFPDSYTIGYYFYGPMLFLIIVNIILFVLTTINIMKSKEETQRTMKHGSKKHNIQDNMQDRYGLYLKLFLAFGINWSFELIPWLIGQAPPIQIYLDVMNILYGIFIFYISVCRPNVIQEIKNRIGFTPCFSTEVSDQTTDEDSKSKECNTKL